MIFLQAFLVGGVFCFLGQLLFANTKLGFVKIFMICITLGVLLTAFGWMDPIVQFGGAGMMMSIIDAGEGLYWSMVTLFSGAPAVLIRFVVMIALVLASGLICGFLTGLRKPSEAQAKANAKTPAVDAGGEEQPVG